MKTKATILIVDDDRDYTEATKMILENASYTVETANTREEAMEKLEELVPDLIILDMMMQKGAEGFTLSRVFKKKPALAGTPILVCTSITDQTGYRFLGDPRHEKFFPVEDILEKPVVAAKLLAKVDQLLSAGKGN
jgi:CheY-like chemotaxis protein